VVFRDLELGQSHQAPWWPQAVVLAQGGEAEVAAVQLPAQITLDASEVVGSGGDMEGIDHHLGRLIRRQGHQELAPQLPPALRREQVVLQLRPQQRPWFAAQAFDHMAEIDPPPWTAHPGAPMQPRQGLHELAAQEQIQPVMAQVHRELLADQP
jgi:hypothetical protein